MIHLEIIWFIFLLQYEFSIPNSEFRIPNSEFRIPHFEKNVVYRNFVFGDDTSGSVHGVWPFDLNWNINIGHCKVYSTDFVTNILWFIKLLNSEFQIPNSEF